VGQPDDVGGVGGRQRLGSPEGGTRGCAWVHHDPVPRGRWPGNPRAQPAPEGGRIQPRTPEAGS
jgi:hypothetical protein